MMYRYITLGRMVVIRGRVVVMRLRRVGCISVVVRFNTTGGKNCLGRRWCRMRDSGGISTKGRRSTSRSLACSVLCVVIGLGGHDAGDELVWQSQQRLIAVAETLATMRTYQRNVE